MWNVTINRRTVLSFVCRRSNQKNAQQTNKQKTHIFDAQQWVSLSEWLRICVNFLLRRKGWKKTSEIPTQEIKQNGCVSVRACACGADAKMQHVVSRRTIYLQLLFYCFCHLIHFFGFGRWRGRCRHFEYSLCFGSAPQRNCHSHNNFTLSQPKRNFVHIKIRWMCLQCTFEMSQHLIEFKCVMKNHWVCEPFLFFYPTSCSLDC